ncbi:hypothetical protein N9A28_07665 [Sulfurimonas sp.]|nr:hypothetical protein [Sulfurimonas sp.]
MSEQAKILEDMQELIMAILKKGAATEEEGNKLDELENLMLQQKCYRSVDNENYECQGEEITSLLFNKNINQAIDKLIEYEITAEDFFGFAEYHYDEDDEAEIVAIFTDELIVNVNKMYKDKANT